jgi:hypothetical protein
LILTANFNRRHYKCRTCLVCTISHNSTHQAENRLHHSDINRYLQVGQMAFDQLPWDVSSVMVSSLKHIWLVTTPLQYALVPSLGCTAAEITDHLNAAPVQCTLTPTLQHFCTTWHWEPIMDDLCNIGVGNKTKLSHTLSITWSRRCIPPLFGVEIISKKNTLVVQSI